MSQATKSTTLIPSRRALLAGAPAAAAAALAAGGAVNIVATATARPSSVDPIFAVIAEHRAAHEQHEAACEQEEHEPDDDKAMEAIDVAHERAMAAEWALFTTAPTTVAGVAALLAYVATESTADDQTILLYGTGWSDEELVTAVKAFPAHVAAALRNIAADLECGIAHFLPDRP